ncbi:MAG TPA: AMP-binding protein [Bacillales bacterium]|nr:AMP-binding protein [Bacillales bacterium]
MTKLLEQTIGELLRKKAESVGDHEAIVYQDQGIRYTYKEFYELSGKVAKGLIGLGIEKGEHIAAWATNVPEWLLLQFGSARAGAVLVTVNTSYQERELEYLLQQSDCTTLFLIEGFKGSSYVDIARNIVNERKEKIPYLRNLVYLGEKSETPEEMKSWSDLLDLAENVSDAELQQRESSLHYNDVINMQYTSGTTGFPKGVMLTHYNIANNGFQIAQAMNLTHEDRLCIPVPFFHCFGCVLGTLAAASVGATMVPVVEFTPEKVLQTVEAERCTALHGVPTMFIAELNLDNFESFDLSTLRTGIMAGSPCPIEVMKKVINLMGMDEITIAYGQTESSPVITQTRTDDPIERRVNTVGKVMPHVEVKIIDPASEEQVLSNTPGELCTRGYHVMKGYYKMEEATSGAIDEEGWLHTGDLATIDEEGYVQITGRLKDMIIRGGENIYPREIEEFLYTHPDVLDVQVIGAHDERYGEQVAAYIRKRPEAKISEEDLREYCKGKIAKYKIPKYLFFVEGYPMTASGKVQKYKLREEVRDWIRKNEDTPTA